MILSGSKVWVKTTVKFLDTNFRGFLIKAVLSLIQSPLLMSFFHLVCDYNEILQDDSISVCLW